MHPQVRLLYLAIFAYVAAEIGVATWMVDFLQKSRHISVVESSMYLSVHFAGIAVGRLFGSLFVDRLGHLQSLLLFSVLSSGFYCHRQFWACLCIHRTCLHRLWILHYISYCHRRHF